MQKLNSSVRKCLETNCNILPTIQLESAGVSRSNVPFTAAQALVCSDHVNYGKEYLQQHFPGLPIRELKNPRWLSREQEKIVDNGLGRRK